MAHFRLAQVGSLSVQNIVDGVVDEFEDETGVDTGTSTDETYDSSNDYYNNPGGNSRLTGGTPTVPLAGGTPDNFNDDSLGTTSTTSSFGNISGYSHLNRGFAKLDFGSNQSVVEVQLEDHWYTGGSGSTCQIYYSTDDVTYTAYGSAITMNGVTTRDSTRTVSVSARYIIVSAAAANFGSDSANIKKMNVYASSSPANMSLQSNATTANAVPTDAHIVVWQEDVDGVTLNTDLIVSVSRDGGTTWTAVTLVDKATLTTGRILAASVDISAQPSGTSMKWKAVVANNKEQKIHAVGLQWS